MYIRECCCFYGALLCLTLSPVCLPPQVSGGNLFSASGTPSLAALMRSVAQSVRLPGSLDAAESDVYTKWLQTSRTASGNERLNEPLLGRLACGSDYTVFQQHLGIASLHFAFSNEPFLPVYHSDYDSFYW